MKYENWTYNTKLPAYNMRFCASVAGRNNNKQKNANQLQFQLDGLHLNKTSNFNIKQ